MQMIIDFFGVRGTLPVPGKKTLRYGGNTNCVTLRLGEEHFFIFDSGTGIKELSNHLIRENIFPIKGKIFISHPHYDHINGLPFFVPLYKKGNEFEFLGTNQHRISLEKVIADQMDSIYFPITMNEFSAKVSFHELQEETFYINDVKVQTILLNHPGRCLGYRIQFHDKSFCYITDNELYLKNSPYYSAHDVEKLVHFIEHTDVLLMDSTYSDAEYQRKTGWGHSSVTRVVEVAHEAKVKLLCLFHHDPDQYDVEIDLKLEHANSLLHHLNSTVRCIAPHEGQQLII